MGNSNKSKEPNPIIEEVLETPIPGEETPDATPQIKMEDVLAKEASDITPAEMDFLSDHKDDLTDEQKVKVGLADPETIEPIKEQPKEEVLDEKDRENLDDEIVEDKEQKYRAQQAEAEVLRKSREQIFGKVDEAAKLSEPTEEELRGFVKQDGADWDELSLFEKAMARRTFMGERKFGLVHEAVQASQKVDEWSNKVDSFIDTVEGKAEYAGLSGHEADFKKYTMKESHRGVDMEVLVGSFLHSLPPVKKNRTSLFNKGGGGERTEKKEGIEDADQVALLRKNDPKEYQRQVRAGNIKIEV